LRSLRKADWVNGGVVLTAAFVPDTRTAEERADGGGEVSVNWEDHERVEGFALGEFPQAAHGLARLPRAQVDRVNGLPGSLATLMCERRVRDDNPHHGNVVFRRGLGKPHTAMIAGALALASSHVPQPPKE